MFCYTLAKVTKKYDIDPSKSKFIYLLSDRKSISTLLECEAHRQKPHKRRCVCFSAKDSESEIIRIQVCEFHQLSLSLKSNNKDKSMNMNKLKGLLIMMIDVYKRQGVMVTLQILVLSFLVRVRVSQLL